jgi:hypothetical protein
LSAASSSCSLPAWYDFSKSWYRRRAASATGLEPMNRTSIINSVTGRTISSRLGRGSLDLVRAISSHAVRMAAKYSTTSGGLESRPRLSCRREVRCSGG